MPQLDPTSFSPQLIWLAITFVVLFFLMAKVALPRVGAAIDRRKVQIDGDLDRATKLKAEIDIVIQAYERALAEARTQASATVNETKERLSEIASKRSQAAIAALAEKTATAEARIAAAKTEALANVRTIAVEAARAATSRLIGDDIDDTQLGATVDQVMKGRA
ncbi:MAG TPA: F0F1 ATP synthase subunit B' [Aliidongia sp.]|uniref:F0F1 ATP synthase subunit B family protein n=1 Tax=Aliidongia sp. TaxID=1914230 RepID=UPI002DDCF250|nr:F0F1 ATP synthase subunit B' [Aliidongia sp.]HEV2676591.1 F0F1 ATP synthase subunit B' [Aliidongia sp.]